MPTAGSTKVLGGVTSTLADQTISTITPSIIPSTITTLTRLLTSPIISQGEKTRQDVVISEVLAIYNGTYVTSGGSTAVLGGMTKTLVDQTISTVLPSKVTTITSVHTAITNGEILIVSEIYAIYNATYVYNGGTVTTGSTNIIGGVDSTIIDQTTTLFPSETGAFTTTDGFGAIYSEETGIIGGSTVTLTVATISTISSVDLSLFTSVSGTSFGPPTIDLTMKPTPTFSGGSTSCEVFLAATPTEKPVDGLLTCALDPAKVDYSGNFSYDNPINNTYWMEPAKLSQFNTSYTALFCSSVVGPGSAYVLGPDSGSVPEGAQQSEQLLYTNSVHRSFSSLTAVTGDDGELTIPATFSITYDSAACGKGSNQAVVLSGLTFDYCWEMFATQITNYGNGAGCHTRVLQDDPEIHGGIPSDIVPTQGGSMYDSCLVWGVATKTSRPPDCPRAPVL